MNIFRCSCDIRSQDAMLLVAFGYSLMLVAVVVSWLPQHVLHCDSAVAM